MITETLLKKYIKNNCTPEETEQVLDFLSQQESNRMLLQHFQQQSKIAFENPMPINIGTSNRIERKLLKSIQSNQHAPRFFLKTTWFRYAAAIIIIFGAGTYFWLINKTITPRDPLISEIPVQTIHPGSNQALLTIGGTKAISLSPGKTGIAVNKSITYNDGEKIAEAGQMLQLSTPRGGQYQAVLPDGSKVWLNAASSIKFPSKFEGKERRVEVSGEVYLEVATNKEMPFFVSTNKTTVQVLGTSFNINAYEDEEVEKTTLIEGSLRINANAQSVLLKPGEQAIVEGVVNATIRKTLINQMDVIAWKNGFFKFNNADIGTVMRQIARWYNLEVVFEGARPTDKFGGEISRSVTAEKVLKVIAISGVRFKIVGNKIIVTK